MTTPEVAPGRQGTRPQTARMSAEELRALPPVVDLVTAAAALGVGRTTAYELARSGRWPTPIFRLGGRIKVPTVPLLELLGVSTGAAADPVADITSSEQERLAGKSRRQSSGPAAGR
jgi:hypothetical protein